MKSVTQTVLASRPCIKHTIYSLTIILILTGCTNHPQTIVNLNSSAHQSSLEQKKHWLIRGKLGIKGPEKKQSSNFRWQQEQEKYQLNLTSILGSSILTMKGDKNKVTLVFDDKTYQDSDPEHLIWRVTGWQIPVEKLRFWVKGQHHKNDKVLTGEQGWVNQLQPQCDNCENWLINYDNYKLIDDVWLPHKVVLHNNINNSQLLIFVNEWDLNE